MKRILFIIAVFTILSSCSTPLQLEVSNVDKDEIASNYKIYYALPSTELKIIIVQKSAVYQPGRYAKFAEHYFLAKPQSLLMQKKYNIVNVKVVPQAVYDSSRVFSISNLFTEAISLNDKGFLNGVNYWEKTQEENTIKSFKEVQNKNKETEIINFPKEFFTLKDEYSQAKFLAEKIYTLREDMHFLAIGEGTENALPDGKSLKEMINYLHSLEKDYLNLFYGHTTVKYDTLTFYFTPKNKTGEQQILFRFSPTNGIVPTTNINAYPIFIDVKPYATRIDELETRAQIVRSKSFSGEGLKYCIPAVAKVIIRDEEEYYFKGEIPVAQLGTIATLPPFWLQPNTQISINPKFGSLNFMKLME